MSDLNSINNMLRGAGLPEITVDDIFPVDAMVAVSKKPLPPGIEAYRVRLIEMIDAIDRDAKREIEALPSDLRARRALGIMNRAQERAQEFIMQLLKIEEMYARTVVIVNLPPRGATPSGSENHSG